MITIKELETICREIKDLALEHVKRMIDLRIKFNENKCCIKELEEVKQIVDDLLERGSTPKTY